MKRKPPWNIAVDFLPRGSRKFIPLLATGVKVQGGEPEESDVTTVYAKKRKPIPVPLFSPVLEHIIATVWDPSDVGLIAIKTASMTKRRVQFRYSFSNGRKFLFFGYVAEVGPLQVMRQRRKRSTLVSLPVRVVQSGAGRFQE